MMPIQAGELVRIKNPFQPRDASSKGKYTIGIIIKSSKQMGQGGWAIIYDVLEDKGSINSYSDRLWEISKI